MLTTVAATLARTMIGRSSAERLEYYAHHAVPSELQEQVEAWLLAFGDRQTAVSLTSSTADDAPTSITDVRTTTAPASPERIGRYHVGRLLGRGGMSEVYLARDPVLERDIALKFLAEEIDDPGARDRLAQEARAAGRLRHPNIVTIFDVGEQDGRSFIAMEYVPGETLGRLIRNDTVMPLSRKLELFEGVCGGLAHAHRAGVIHLDIKPDNLILDETGILRVLDFGIARVLTGESHLTRHLSGTLRYMSPEQLEGRPLNHRSDVFSLGAALFEFVSGKPAFAGSPQELMVRICLGPAPKLPPGGPGSHPAFDLVLGRAMARDPIDRYDDLDDMRTALVRLRESIAVEAERPGIRVHTVDQVPAAPVAVRRTWRRWLGGVAGIGLVGVAAWATWGPRSNSADPVSSPAPPPAVNLERDPSGPSREPAPATPRSTPPAPPATADANAPKRDERATEAVWRQLARGDRAGVLDALRTLAVGQPAASRRLATELADAARLVAVEARQTARANSSAETASKRTADGQLSTAESLLSDGRGAEALPLLWQATDAYRQLASAADPPLATTQPVATAGSERVPPLLPSAPGVSRETAAVASAEPTVTPSRPPSGAPPPRVPSDEELVLNVLHRYQQGFQTMDVAAIQGAFPRLSRTQLTQIQDTFKNLVRYDMEIRSPRVDVRGNAANVRASVARRLVLKRGDTESSEVQSEFLLQRDASGAWSIADVTALGK